MSRLNDSLKKLVPKNVFARGVSVLVGGTASAQLLLLLAAPVLTRIYTPEEFGMLAVYAGLLAMFTIVSSLRYEVAIPLPKSNVEATNLMMLSIGLVLISTAISGIMIAMFGKSIASLLNIPGLDNVFWLLPVGVLMSGIYNVFSYWAIRTKAFPDIARSRISQASATLIVQLLGYKLGGFALLLGQVCGHFVGGVRLSSIAFNYEEAKSWSWQGVVYVASRYRKFPIFSTWSGLFNTAGSQLPPLMLASIYSSGAAGLYALAHRVIAMPISIIGDAIGKVFFANATEASKEGCLNKLVETGTTNLIKIGLPGTVFIVITAPELFGIIFGENWIVAGNMARWIIVWLFFQFVSSPLSTIIFVLEKENYNLIFQIMIFIFRMTSILLSSLYFDYVKTIIVFSMVSVISYVIYSVLIIKLSSSSIMNIIISLRYYFMKYIALMSPIIILGFFGLKNVSLLYLMFITLFLYGYEIKQFYKKDSMDNQN